MRRSFVFPIQHLVPALGMSGALLLMAAAALGSDPDSAAVSALVPVVAGVHGYAGIEWRTDLSLRNDTAADLDIVLTLPVVPGQPFILTSITAGQSMLLPDLVHDTFGQSEAISPLLVQTLGVRSVTVGAVIYPVVNGVPGRGEFVPVYYGDAGPGESQLSMLRLGAGYRTNVGLVNLGESEAHFTVALRRLEGRNLAVMNIAVPPSGLVQMPLQTLFPLISEGDDFAIVADCTSDRTYAYASVISNDTQEARYAQPLPVARN